MISTSHRIDVRRPFAADALFEFLGSRAIPGVERVSRDGKRWRYERTCRFPAASGVLALAWDGSTLVAESELLDTADEEPAYAAACRIADAGCDPATIRDVLGADSRLHPALDARPGLRVPGCADPAELAVRALVGQQISVARASAATGRIAAAYGDPLDTSLGGDGVAHLFPTPAALRRADPADLRMPRTKGGALVALAVALDDGALDLAGPDHDAQRAVLTRIKGIGPWTAGYISMRAGRDPDVLLATDLIARRAAGQVGLPDSPRELLSDSERFSPWRSYLTMYLWSAYRAPSRTRRPRTPS